MFKRERERETKKQKKNPPQIERHTKSETREIAKQFLCKWRQKISGIAIPILDKMDFTKKTIIIDKNDIT